MKNKYEKKRILSIIIPFLNEGDEVENTLQSIRSFSDENFIEIILINDASDDGYDYETIAEKYNTVYIHNEERLGVAASRDKGIGIASSSYFLLLDAHMRFYDSQWVETILNHLESRKKVLLCCQTQVLMKENDEVVEKKALRSNYGAYIDFNNPDNLTGASWTGKEFPGNNDPEIAPIACVLGAGYACTKKYWEHLRGLKGLLYYGSDESYISLKVWLSGGECLLLKNVIIGHIYRSQFPYVVTGIYTLYNRLLIAELLLPENYRKEIFSLSKSKHLGVYNEALRMLMKNREQISELKAYYKKMAKRKFKSFIDFNNKVQVIPDKKSADDEILKELAYSLVTKCHSIEDLGLMSGRMGIIIYLYHYAEYSKESFFEALAEYLLDELSDGLHISQSVNFYSGLAGIGWGVEYLSRNGFISGDTNDLLEEFDEKIMELNPRKIKDLDFNFGLGGIVHYILSRLYSVNEKKLKNPFSKDFLKKLYLRIEKIIENKTASDSLDIFIQYCQFYNNESIAKPSLYDIYPLSRPKDFNPKYKRIGLDGGSASVGLKIILDLKK